MQFHKQRFRHDPENGIYGDCFRTALACLLDLEPEDVPHFMDGDPPAEEFWPKVTAWLAARGLALFSTAYACDLEAVLAFMKAANPGVRYLIAGQSPRGTTHQVIGLDDEIIHDPHVDGGGLIGPCAESGQFWINVLVPTGIHSALLAAPEPATA